MFKAQAHFCIILSDGAVDLKSCWLYVPALLRQASDALRTPPMTLMHFGCNEFLGPASFVQFGLWDVSGFQASSWQCNPFASDARQ